MTKDFAGRKLDIKAFAEEKGHIEGRESDFPRLAAETRFPGQPVVVQWQADGELRNAGHVTPEIWLRLRAETGLPLTCQRCLGEVKVPLSVDRMFRFVADEATAAAQDDASEEDVLALSKGFDLCELVEDELLMELPVAPRHGVCPEPVILAVADADFVEADESTAHPFAALEKLKTGRR